MWVVPTRIYTCVRGAITYAKVHIRTTSLGNDCGNGAGMGVLFMHENHIFHSSVIMWSVWYPYPPTRTCLSLYISALFPFAYVCGLPYVLDTSFHTLCASEMNVFIPTLTSLVFCVILQCSTLSTMEEALSSSRIYMVNESLYSYEFSCAIGQLVALSADYYSTMSRSTCRVPIP